MKIVLAPQSFKGSLSAFQVAEALKRGILRIVPNAQTVLVPMADGGDGTLDVLLLGTGGRAESCEVAGPLGMKVKARWGVMGEGKTAIIEMAEASGLTRVPVERRDPLTATTYGTGELIRAALDRGYRQFIIGVGGSATNDGGAGMAQALGATLSDDSGKPLTCGGAALAALKSIDISSMDQRIRDSHFRVASDVTNPLCGPHGASAVYGPQKGATPEMAEELDRALEHYAEVIHRDLGIEVKEMPGAGAAGGLGAGVVAFLRADILPGVELVADAIGLSQHLQDADLLITGEGRVDAQSGYGKTVMGVASRAKALDVPVVVVAGSVGEGHESLYQHGVDAVVSITSRPMTLEEAMRNAEQLVKEAAEHIIRLLLTGRRLQSPM